VKLKTSFRRSTAVVAGAFIGLAGAFALVGPASAHYGGIEGVAKCADNGWTVEWTLTTANTNNKVGTLSNVQPTTGTKPLTVIVDGAKVQPNGSLTETQSFSNDTHSAKLSAHVSWPDNAKADLASPKVWAPRDCHTTPPSTPPSTPPATPGGPTPILTQDCTTMTIGLANPKNGKTITLDFETKKGEKRHDVIAPDETKTEKFSATPGFWVKVTPTGFEGATPETINYEQPAGCDTTGSGGGLPVTGAAAGSIAAGAAVLLVGGAALFMVARRRRVKFTA
jgi:LPXTG-motif cell wall-anchored protein